MPVTAISIVNIEATLSPGSGERIVIENGSGAAVTYGPHPPSGPCPLRTTARHRRRCSIAAASVASANASDTPAASRTFRTRRARSQRSALAIGVANRSRAIKGGRARADYNRERDEALIQNAQSMKLNNTALSATRIAEMLSDNDDLTFEHGPLPGAERIRKIIGPHLR